MVDVTDAIDKEVDLLQNKLKDTLRAEEERGANVQGLGRRAENLQERATMFQAGAREVRTKLWWKNFKWMVIAGIFLLLVAIAVYRFVLK